jgi:hypothetical protein
MGHSQSSPSNSKSSPTTQVSAFVPPVASSLQPLLHAIVLGGLSGSGRSTVQKQLGVKDQRKLEIDERFLTTPKIFDTGYNANTPHYGDNMDKSLWSYGGRGSVRARWTSIAYSTKAIVFTVDSTDRGALAPPVGFQPLPVGFVSRYSHKSPAEQAEMLATLKKTMTVQSVLQNMLTNEWALTNKPLLILATKQDQPGAMSLEEISTALDLESIVKNPQVRFRRDWRLAGCNAITGEGLEESVDWLNFIIAHPTDWTQQQDAEYAKQRAAASPPKPQSWYAERSVAQQVVYLADELQKKLRDERFAAGGIFRAPPIWKMSGELWAPTPEQQKEFVVAPVTADEAEIEREAMVKARELKKASLTEQIQIRLEEVLREQGKMNKLESIADSLAKKEEKVVDVVEAASSSSTPPESSSDAESEADSISSRATTVSHTPEPSTPPQQEAFEVIDAKSFGEIIEKDQLHLSAVKEFSSAAPSAPRFTSLSSTSIVLPAPSTIPRSQLVLKKKHFWSKKQKLVEQKGEEDIHEVGSWGMF